MQEKLENESYYFLASQQKFGSSYFVRALAWKLKQSMSLGNLASTLLYVSL